jgi:flagellar hook protein FlgE
MTISALSSGVSGLQRATQRLETSAARIANPATPGADMAEDLV